MVLGKKNNRNSNIELLRIISMLFVIILHFNVNGAMEYCMTYNKLVYFVLILLESLCICAVNVFMLISGYFLYNKDTINFKKPFVLICDVIIINILYEFFRFFVLKEGFSIGAIIPANYFVIFYVSVYFIGPFINSGLRAVKNDKMMLIVLLLVLSVYPSLVDVFQSVCKHYGVLFADLSSITRTGSQYGYTIVNFVLMYIIGAELRKNNKQIDMLQSKNIFIGIVCCVVFICSTAILENKISGVFVLGCALSYANPIVIILSILVFILFLKLKINKTTNLVNALSGAAFTVYLVHTKIIHFFIDKSLLDNGILVVLIYLLILLVSLYAIGWIVWYCLELIKSCPVFKLVKKRDNNK